MSAIDDRKHFIDIAMQIFKKLQEKYPEDLRKDAFISATKLIMNKIEESAFNTLKEQQKDFILSLAAKKFGLFNDVPKERKNEPIEDEKMKVTHDNFDEMMKRVTTGGIMLCIFSSSSNKTIHITKEYLDKFGSTVITKAKDGKGFIMQRGKYNDYVFSSSIYATKRRVSDV